MIKHDPEVILKKGYPIKQRGEANATPLDVVN
jgi:hypothetical protein